MIDEIHYEITMRTRVYPGQIARGKMRASEAEYRLCRMRAVLATLEHLRLKQEQEKKDD
jgi:hypothetical protein